MTNVRSVVIYKNHDGEEAFSMVYENRIKRLCYHILDEANGGKGLGKPLYAIRLRLKKTKAKNR